MPEPIRTEDHFCLARQAIADRQLNLVGYELLYRANDDAREANVQDHLQASARVYSLALLDLGAGHLTSGLPLSINVPQFWVQQDELFPEIRTPLILEIQGPLQVSDSLLESLQSLRRKGYSIAFDASVIDDHQHELLHYAQWIKINTQHYSEEQIRQKLRLLKDYPVKRVAEKIETWQSFQQLEALGFDYFQGFFLSRPQLFRGQQAQSNPKVLLDLLQQLFRSEMDIEQLVSTLVKDPALTYRLLRHINSASYMLQKEVTSLHQAVVILGQERLRAMVSLLLWSKSPFRSSPQLPTLLVRARACELLARHHKLPQVQTCFTVGVLSNLHLALGMEASELAHKLKLEPAIACGLEGKGIPGEILQLVIAYEQGDWDRMEASPWYQPETNACFLEAITWADNAVADLK